MRSRRRRRRRTRCDVAPQVRRRVFQLTSTTWVLLVGALQLVAASTSLAAADYQLTAQAGEATQLPCLIGRPAYCGEPYLIAWYKLNATSKGWSRLEHEVGPAEDGGRLRFLRPRGGGGGGVASSAQLCERPIDARLLDNFECAQLAIRPLEPNDEGQYKCEITFSESLDFDKCPAATTSQLNVIAQPNEPELLVNGRPASGASGPSAPVAGTFREGAQVRLECQSAGGRPAPRIEWLNISSADSQQQQQVQLMRANWPQRRTSHLEGSQLITSASVTFTLNRRDLRSQFACLVQATGPQAAQPTADQLPRLLAGGANSMLKRIRLDVQVKPDSARLLVRDLELNQTLRQVGAGNEQLYSLQPQRLYAIQCLVEGSRPQSRLAWFNRSQPIELEQVELEESEFVVPAERTSHRLSSFTRTIQLADGTFSTTGTLLFTASAHDDLEELFCRLSNEAFPLDELVQVAPIMAARLQVNFAPMAWLEPISADTNQQHRQQQQLVKVDELRPLELRCWLAANPLAHNTIVQLEWLRDGRKLAPNPTKAAGQRLQVEGANHLHLPADGRHAPAARLLCSSRLSIARAHKADAGAYSCQFKLIPAPGDGLHRQPASRILQGQSQRPIQVQVIEAKPKRPTIRIASSSGLLVYGLQAGAKTDNQHLTLLADSEAQLGFSCDSDDNSQQQQLSKVMWYLNGQLFHSATSNLHNLTLASLLARDSALGALSCAHYVSGGQTDFHGGSVRLYQSRNQLNLRVKVGPRLLERHELMPSVRSFSEPELHANPANKLKLICLAQCEPVCSIDWHLTANGRQLSLLASNGQPQTTLEPNEATFVSKSQLDPQWTQLENLIKSNSSSFAWSRQTNLQAANSQLASQLDLEAQWRQLMRDAEPHQPAANVFSRLEFTYQQLSSQLFSNLPAADGQVEDADQILVKCRINATLVGRLGHLLVEAHRWFPEAAAEEEPDGDELGARPVALARLPLNLAAVAATGNGRAGAQPEIDNESHQMQPASSAHWTQFEQLEPIGQQPSSSSPATVDEMQISIRLEKPPRRVRVKFAGLANSSQDEPASVTLSEGQLLELVDPNKSPPLLHCQASCYPTPQFRWTFIDLNQTEHLLASESATGQLDLRQFIEFRQRQLQVDPSSAYGLDVVSSIVGNYTCTASNIHGSRQASMSIQIQGRPLCKLTLGRDFVTPNNELMVNLVCSVYSNPLLLETIWFRNGQQLVVNKSSLDAIMSPLKSPLSRIELPVMLLDKQKNPTLTDLTSNQLANFKCIARNPLGYSEACELSPAHRQALIGAIKTISSSSKIPALNIILNNFPTDIRSQTPASVNLISMNSSDLTNPPSLTFLKGLLLGHMDLVLIIACSLAIAWLLIMIATAFVRQRFGRKPSGSMLNVNHNTSWRFNGTANRRELSNQEIGQPIAANVPYQSKMIANYYGDSNGDSEHDIIQSCSQSSHYEDYGVQNLQLQQRLLNQPLYHNGNSGTNGTLQTSRARHLKPSLSSDSSTGTRLTRSNYHQDSIYNTRNELPNFNNTKLALTMRDGPVLNNTDRYSTGGNLNLSNVPLINNGTTTRINLDHRNHANHHGRTSDNSQRTFCAQTRNNNSEHIYDDVVYNQIIL